MFTWNYTFFIGDDADDIHVGFAAGENIFIIGEASAKDEGSELKDTLDTIKSRLESTQPQSLDGFVTIVEEELGKIDTDLIACAAAYNVGKVIYLYTAGTGEIYISRAGSLQKLLYGDNTASGFLHEMDYFLLSNKAMSAVLSDSFLKDLMSHAKPSEAIEAITPELKSRDNVGMIGLFMQAQTVEEIAATEIVQELAESDETVYKTEANQYSEALETPQKQTRSMPRLNLKERMQSITARLGAGTSSGKKATFALVIILLLILTWSVVSGNSRRERARFDEEVVQQQSVIEQKLTEAEDIVGVNTQKSLQLIDESREIVTRLEQEAESNKYDDIPALASLASQIADAEQGILKKEEGQYEEYYDLELIEKGAEAVSMYKNDEALLLLDSENGNIYVLDIAEKSVETYSDSKIRDATSVAYHQGIPYMFGSSIGIIRMPDRSSVEAVIAEDSDWKSVKDFWMFSGNLYLLDAGNDEIYKYLVAEEGFSEKRSYFGDGQSIDLSKASAMAIDASIYVTAGSRVFKYSSGVSQQYLVDIPDEEGVTFDDVFASEETDDVYLLDKETQRIFVVDKDSGELQKQISASMLKDASDFVVDENEGILVLSKNTIYSIKDK